MFANILSHEVFSYIGGDGSEWGGVGSGMEWKKTKLPSLYIATQPSGRNTSFFF